MSNSSNEDQWTHNSKKVKGLTKKEYQRQWYLENRKRVLEKKEKQRLPNTLEKRLAKYDKILEQMYKDSKELADRKKELTDKKKKIDSGIEETKKQKEMSKKEMYDLYNKHVDYKE